MSINQAYTKLPRSYYHNADVVFLAKDLLGKQIFTNFNNKLTSGIIVETEAYRSTGDRACLGPYAKLNVCIPSAPCWYQLENKPRKTSIGGVQYPSEE